MFVSEALSLAFWVEKIFRTISGALSGCFLMLYHENCCSVKIVENQNNIKLLIVTFVCCCKDLHQQK